MSNFAHGRARLVLICCSVAANALCAGGIFMFPLLSPALAFHLKLTQPQLTTIASAGMMGQYPFSAIVGKVFDRYGGSACSLIAAVLFTFAFGSFSLEISMATDESSPSSFLRLALFFFLAGLATVFSCFSSIFSAAKAFPDYPGIASGASMALFGLSPFCLSIIASTFFTNPASGFLDMTQFITFLAILTGTIHIIGALNLRTAPNGSQVTGVGDVDETTALIPRKPDAASAEVGSSYLDILRDRDFWLLGVFCILTLGVSEMVMSNLGTIILSLPSISSLLNANDLSTDTITSHQVRLLSVSNTAARIILGPLADLVSPVALSINDATQRRHRVSRVVFLSGPALLLSLTFFWMEFGVRCQEAAWALSIGIGISYGGIFTVLPGIMSSVWGLPNVGRNFGMITYAPFIGTPLFSYLYAFVAASNTEGQAICKGLPCWQLTFWVSFGTSILAFCGSLVLWRRWEGRV